MQNEKSTPVRLVGLSQEEMKLFAEEIGESSFRGRQLFQWVYEKRASTFAEMTSLSASLRGRLETAASLESVRLVDSQKSTLDGTIKFVFATHDGGLIESVLIPSKNSGHSDNDERRTLCISTQIGCPVGCTFCATGTMGLARNLTAGEIIGQIIEAERATGQSISNVVYMGMGEPFLNYDATVKSLRILLAEGSLGIAARHITMSTVGYPDQIRRFADEPERVKLAVSLHTADDAIRSQLIPSMKKITVREIRDALQEYYSSTRRRVTLEYVMLAGINDRARDAKKLIAFSNSVPSKINLIPFHAPGSVELNTNGLQFRPSTPESIERFAEILRNANCTVMIRSSAGRDIEAACGQLVISHLQRETIAK